MPAVAVDGTAVQQLAALDPALGHLGAALDRVDRDGGELDDACWTPGVGCRLAYRVAAGQGSGVYRDVTVAAQGWSERDYRQDPSMPGLAGASDPVVVADRLAELLGPATWSVDAVRYRAGSRCVLRYGAETRTGPARVYAKVFSPRDFARAARTMVTVSRAVEVSGAVPQVLGVWSDLGAVLVDEAPGRSASAVLGDPDLDTAVPAALGRELGVLLARFHQLHHPASRSETPTERLVLVGEELAAMRRADPGLAERCDLVVQALRQDIPPSGARRLTHGAFRAGQVVVADDGHLTLLDVDGACCCDPARDLGTMSAHLTWAGLRGPDSRRVLVEASSSFLAAYEEAAGPVGSESLRWWYAVALLQCASRRFRRLETAWWPMSAGLVDAAEDLVRVPSGPPPDRGVAIATGGTGATGAAGVGGPGGLLRAAELPDAREMARLLEEVVLRPSSSAGDRLVVDSVEQLSVVAGRRTVARYSVRGLERSRPTTVVAKGFAEPHRARLLHEHLRVLSQGPFAEDGLRVPEPLGLVPERGLVLYRAAPGTPLDRVRDPAELLRGLRGAALWLARLHTCGVVLPRGWSLSRERANSRVWADVVGAAYPPLSEAAARVARGWSQGVGRAADPEVPLHKDFHPGHVLVGEATTTVLDLDEARQGDQALDVAHFCAYLEAFGPDRRDVRLPHAFLTEYARASGWSPGESLAGYAAYSWLKIARQWALGSGPCRGAGPDERRAGAARALTRGLAWLGE